ncbi:MAG: glucose-6-phosphate isomerase [Nocardioides sp.]|uniref:glucose-6-phosphate isomerase n=1 Tax=Nocardioides sp. TaxID=35761 RepID=UPI003F0F7BB7
MGAGTSPVDPTTTEPWQRLSARAEAFEPDLRGWFADDPHRVEALTRRSGDLGVDLSKSFLDEGVLADLVALGRAVGLEERRDAMLAGARINTTEDRSVLHTALRRPRGDSLVVDGTDVVAQVHEVLDEMYDFARQVRDGRWLGVTGERIRTVVNIGIGGSDLGPVMAYEALAAFRHPDLECRFISNVDPSDVALTLAGLDPATTLFVVSSKTFTTLETLTNARLARTWLLDGLAGAGVVGDDRRADAVARHFVAVSTHLDEVAAFGIDTRHAFGFWDWVGGRYSLDSAIGLSLLLAIGPEHFADLLAGFHTMDEHFAEAPLEDNVPALLGLLNVWYSTFLGAATHAVLPYSQLLHRFPAYLQQLTMESNGKRVRWDGSAVTTSTGEVYWGEPGTNGQHAFFQLLHQGTQLVPADFIAFARPAFPLRDGDTDAHTLLLANFLAQTRALAFGRTAEEVRAAGVDEALVSARTFPGNRPTTSIVAPALTPGVLGQLIALYEHITFTQGVVWGINSFDQWGVELGKQMASEIAPALSGDDASLASQDASTRWLVEQLTTERGR